MSVPTGHSQLKPPKPWPLARRLQSHLWQPGPLRVSAIQLSVKVQTLVLLELGSSTVSELSGGPDPT